MQDAFNLGLKQFIILYLFLKNFLLGHNYSYKTQSVVPDKSVDVIPGVRYTIEIRSWTVFHVSYRLARKIIPGADHNTRYNQLTGRIL